jgi:hypothetical protein
MTGARPEADLARSVAHICRSARPVRHGVRKLAAIGFAVGAVLLALLFADVAFTKLFAGQWLGYLVMLGLGIGAVACCVAARACFSGAHSQPNLMRSSGERFTTPSRTRRVRSKLSL